MPRTRLRRCLSRRASRGVALFALAFLFGLCFAGPSWGRVGQGIQMGSFVVSPYLELRLFHDTNVFLTPDDEEEDSAISGQLGFRFYQASDRIRSQGRAYYYVEDYFDADAADDEDFGAEFSVSTGQRETGLLKASASYRKTDETDYETGTIEGRKILDTGLLAARDLTDKTDLELGYGFTHTDFDDDDLFDRDSHEISSRVGYHVTDKTDVFVWGGFGTFGSDGTSDSDEVVVRGGVRSRATEKVDFDLGVGWRDHSDTDVGTLSYDALVNWRPNERLALALSAQNEVVPSAQERDNFTLMTTVELAAMYDLTASVSTTLRASYYRNELDDDVVDEEDRTESKTSDTYRVSARVDYAQPSNIYDLFAEVQYEKRNSSLDDEYDQVVASVGTVFRY